MKVIERSNAEAPAEYVNSFRVYSGNNEVVLELGQVDLVASLKSTADNGDPEEIVLDVKGRYLFRPEQITQLINSLVNSLSQGKHQTKGGEE